MSAGVPEPAPPADDLADLAVGAPVVDAPVPEVSAEPPRVRSDVGNWATGTGRLAVDRADAVAAGWGIAGRRVPDDAVAQKLARALFTGFPGESGRPIEVR